MKAQFTILTAFLVILGSLSLPKQDNKSNSHSGLNIAKEANLETNKYLSADKDTVTVPYKIIDSAPTLPYTIRKKGNGSRVMFTEKFGARNLPGVQFYNSSGVEYKIGRKEGFENVTFPFKCTISCSVNFETNRFDYRPSMLNDFEIIIYEPGNWEISFFN